MKTNFLPHAFQSICNHGGIEVEIHDDCEQVRYKFTGDQEPSEWTPILQDEHLTYFVIAGSNEKYFLNEFQKI